MNERHILLYFPLAKLTKGIFKPDRLKASSIQTFIANLRGPFKAMNLWHPYKLKGENVGILKHISQRLHF